MKSLIKLFIIVFVCSLFSSCERENVIVPFQLRTTSVKVNSNDVFLKGESNYIGTYTSRGFCLSTSPNPTIKDIVYVADKSDVERYDERSYSYYAKHHYYSDYHNSYYISNSEISTFTKTINNLEPGKYYVRAYAFSKASIVYSNEYYFTIEK
jgi:hypothetical protein